MGQGLIFPTNNIFIRIKCRKVHKIVHKIEKKAAINKPCTTQSPFTVPGNEQNAQITNPLRTYLQIDDYAMRYTLAIERARDTQWNALCCACLFIACL